MDINLTGKLGVSTIITTAYNPCKSKISQPKTVYAQQKRYWLSRKIDTCSREMLRRDLSKFLKNCSDKGHNIVLCIDLNEDTNRSNGPLYQTLIHENNLIDALKSKHKQPSPPIFENGSKTIDAIFISSQLNSIHRAGWLGFGQGVGDHRIAYIDIDATCLINKDKQDIVPINARRLQIDKEQCMKKYNEYVEPEYRKHKLLPRMNTLRRQTKGKTTLRMIEEIEKIDKTRTEIVKKGEKKCRKLKMGQVPFSPTDVQCHTRLIEFWTLVIKKKGKRKISSRLITRKEKLCGLKNSMQYTVENALEFRSAAWRAYKIAKKTAKERRQEFLRKQILLYDLEGNINAASEVEKISKAEEMREAHREIRQV